MRLDIIRVYRLKDWIHYIGFFILGYSLYSLTITPMFIIQMIEISLILGYAYSLNWYVDKNIGKEHISVFLIPLFMSLLLIPFFDMTNMIIILSFILLVTLYSVPRIRLKRYPIVCSLFNNIGFLLLFLLGASSNIRNLLTIKFFLLLFFLQSAAQFIHEIAHISEDKKEGMTTTAIFFGESRIKSLYSISLFLASIVSMTFIGDTISFLLLTIPTLLFSSYFIFLIDKIEINELRKKYRTCGILTGLLFLLNNIILVVT